MSFERWGELDEHARRVALDGLLERLPTWLELLDVTGQPRFRDARSGETWRLFPGGAVTLGLTPERQAAIDGLVARNPLTLFDPTVHLPAQPVTVSPFFLMEQPILEDGEPKIFILDALEETRKVLSARGQRLPSEAEWEFAWWAVQGQREHWRPASAELCADGWFPDLERVTGRDPLVAGGPAVLRSASFDPAELSSVMPLRQPETLIRLISIRPALDVPA